MNKRGATVSFEMVMWFPRLIYLIIVILFTSGIILAFIVYNVNVGEIESQVLMQGLQYSRDGLVRYDVATGRVYPGVLDRAKISDSHVESTLNVNTNKLAARFELKSLTDEVLETAFLHEETYLNWRPIAALIHGDRTVSGTGAKVPYEESRYVYSGQPSILETVVIFPNG